jgi:hypothetical protein
MAALTYPESRLMSVSVELPSKVRNWPLWWFARLEAAVERGDHKIAALAQTELERLGVTVAYRGRRPFLAEEGVVHAP